MNDGNPIAAPARKNLTEVLLFAMTLLREEDIIDQPSLTQDKIRAYSGKPSVQVPFSPVHGPQPTSSLIAQAQGQANSSVSQQSSFHPDDNHGSPSLANLLGGSSTTVTPVKTEHQELEGPEGGQKILKRAHNKQSNTYVPGEMIS